MRQSLGRMRTPLGLTTIASLQVTAVFMTCVAQSTAAAALQAPADLDSVRVSVPVRGPADTISATLTLPPRGGTKRLPVVVTVSGLGQQPRDGVRPSRQSPRLFGDLAEGLALNGIAVLRWDDRGIGGSAPRTEQSPPLHEVVEDVMALSEWLSQRPDIDPDRIVLLGHSAGGLVALAAGQPPTRFAGLVLMACPGRPLRDMFSAQDSAAMARAPESARDSVRRARDVRYAQRLQEDAFVRDALTLSPESLATRVRIPALVLQGAEDRQVSPDNAIILTRALLRAGASTTVRTLEGLTHFFVMPTTDTGFVGDDGSTRALQTILFGTISEWLAHLPATTGRP